MAKTRWLLLLCLWVFCTASVAQTIDRNDTPATSVPQASPTTITYLSDDVIANVRQIYALGQSLGNRIGVFSKVGDSLTVSRSFLYPFGTGHYNLGLYPHLETVIETYSQHNAHTGNSFTNESLAAHEGWTAQNVIDPYRADHIYCNNLEAPLFCEYRIVRPTIAFIMFGTNDTGFRTVDNIMDDIEDITYFTQELGIIPVLFTIPHRSDAVHQTIQLNEALRAFATAQSYPLIELHGYTVELPNYGLTQDNVHLSSSPWGITATATFMPENLRYGYTVRNLLTLDMLYQLDMILAEQG